MFKYQLHLKHLNTRNPSILTAVPSRPAKSDWQAMHGSPPAQHGVLPRNLRSSPKAAEQIPRRCHSLLAKALRLVSLPWHLTLTDCLSQALPKCLCNKIVPNSGLRLYYWKWRDNMNSPLHCCSAPLQWVAEARHPGLHPGLPAAKSGTEWGRFTLCHPHAWWMSAGGVCLSSLYQRLTKSSPRGQLSLFAGG